jgi:hypothetical protein
MFNNAMQLVTVVKRGAGLAYQQAASSVCVILAAMH